MEYRDVKYSIIILTRLIIDDYPSAVHTQNLLCTKEVFYNN